MFPNHFITTERIHCLDPATSKKRALEQIGRLLASSSTDLTQKTVFTKLLERERLGSTGLGHGIALPHTRIEGIQEACGALLQLQVGVDFDAIDNEPVDLIFGILVPQSHSQEHLQLLAELATLFSDHEFCETLRRETEPDKILQQLLHRNWLQQST